MEEVCNSRVKEINFSMRALFTLSRLESRLGGQISELIKKEALILSPAYWVKDNFLNFEIFLVFAS